MMPSSSLLAGSASLYLTAPLMPEVSVSEVEYVDIAYVIWTTRACRSQSLASLILLKRGLYSSRQRLRSRQVDEVGYLSVAVTP
ncbi:hypothetical protein BS17DRAFT_782330, partial [Gyrodon lividus]